jgi:hypothetical protein
MLNHSMGSASAVDWDEYSRPIPGLGETASEWSGESWSPVTGVRDDAETVLVDDRSESHLERPILSREEIVSWHTFCAIQ